MAVIHFNKEGFDKAFAQGAPMLVDFWADWCGPCKMLAPTVDALAEKLDGKVLVAKVNVDDEDELAQQYHVMSIPTLILFRDGQEVDRIVGLQPQPVLEQFIEDKLNM